MNIKTKEYQLKFISTNPEVLTMGMLVSISGKLPTLEFKKKASKLGHPELGRIMGIQEDDRLGTTYIIMEYATGEWHKYIEDKLIAIAPVIVSEDRIISHATVVYINETSEMVIGRRERGTDIDEITLDDGRVLHKNEMKRVVARPFDIGYIVNNGPPHDRNHDWKDGLYLEEVHPDIIPKLYFMGGKIDLVMGDDLRPEFYNEKIIIDIRKAIEKF